MSSFQIDTHTNCTEKDLINLNIPLRDGERIFLTGDLGAGKSTLIRTLLRSYFSDASLIVRSPTYTYYQQYGNNIYHFDLYRLESLEDFFLIGAKDILDDPESICLIEWPEILGESIIPTQKIHITRTSDTERTIEHHHSLDSSNM